MRIRMIGVVALMALLGVLAGCSTEKPAGPTGAVTPTETATGTPAPSSGGSAAGTSLAPGLYDQPDGTIIAIGTLEYRDLEGGFWAVVDRSGAGGNTGAVAAVIANSGDYQTEINALKGLPVTVKGTRLEGASIRMAGPEIVATSIEAASDTSGPAE